MTEDKLLCVDGSVGSFCKVEQHIPWGSASENWLPCSQSWSGSRLFGAARGRPSQPRSEARFESRLGGLFCT